MQIKPVSLGSQIKERAEFIETAYKHAGSLKALVAQTVDQLHTTQSLTEAMTSIHQMQRLYLAASLGIQGDLKIQEALMDTQKFPLWNEFAAIETSDENQEALAQAMYAGDPQERAPVLLTAADYSRGVAEKIVHRCAENGKEVDVWIDDPVFQRRIYTVATPEISAQYGEIMARRREFSERSITFNLNTPSFEYADEKPNKDIVKKFNAALNERKKKYSANKFFTATRLPTQKMAELDGIPLPEYNDIFFKMAGVSPKKLGYCHGILKPTLDEANVLEFFNNDGTAFKVGIKNMTFANSLMARNVPGGELYSGPEKYSAQGVIVSMGKFIPPTKSSPIEDMTLIFDKGRIIDYAAKNGQDMLSDIINTDEGSRYLGEIALGTNPALRRHVCNSMLVEKIGGSFHVAIGRSYTEKEYMGEPVNVNNGNESQIHWDIATMLFGKEGKILVDGKPIMDKGLYLDPRLSFLNGMQ